MIIHATASLHKNLELQLKVGRKISRGLLSLLQTGGEKNEFWNKFTKLKKKA